MYLCLAGGEGGGEGPSPNLRPSPIFYYVKLISLNFSGEGVS